MDRDVLELLLLLIPPQCEILQKSPCWKRFGWEHSCPCLWWEGTSSPAASQCPRGHGNRGHAVALLCSQGPAGSEGSAGSYPGASGSGKFIKAAELLMVLDVHQDWRSYFNYFT